MNRAQTLLLASIIISLIVATGAQAQGNEAIHGVVVAKADQSALPDTAVRLEGGTLSEPLQTTTGPDGHFGFQRLIPGDYTLVVKHDKFLEQRLQFTLKPREVRNLTVELALLPVEQTVEVTAEAETVAPTYSPSSTTLQSQTVDELPLAERNNLPDMITISAPGMIRSHDDFVHVRGNEIALNTFINGVSFWENPHSVFSAGLNPDIIQSVNVMTGGFPAEYGNRFGGVVDIVTKSGFSMNNEGSFTLGVGTALRNNLAVEYGGHTDRAAYYLNTSGFESARFLSPNDLRAIHDTGRGVRNFLQLDFNVSPKDFLKVVLMADGTNFQIPKTSLDEQFRPDNNASERTREQSAILTWDHVVSNDTQFQAALYQRWSRSLLLPASDPLAAVARVDRTLFTTGLKGDVTRFLGRHTLKAGADLVMLRPDESLYYDGSGFYNFADSQDIEHAVLETPQGGPVTFSDRQTGGQVSLYFQDKMELTNQLTLDAGLRFDRYSLATTNFQFSPRLNLAYSFPEHGTVLHASYNHFFVPPAVEDVLISSAGLTRFFTDFSQPLPPLRPIVEDQVEAGVTQPLRNKLQVGVTGYYRWSDHPVHTVLFPDSRIYAYANFDKGRAYGMEVKLDLPVIQRLGLNAYLNYALARVYFWNPVGAGFVDEIDHLEESGRFLAPMDQTHTLNAGFTWRHPDGLWASMAFEYGSGTPTDVPEGVIAPDRVPEHFTQNLTLGWDLLRHGEKARLGLQFNIENLSNNQYLVSQESVFSPGEYFNPRFYSGSIKIHF